MKTEIDAVECQKQVDKIRRLQKKASSEAFYKALHKSIADAYKLLRSRFDFNDYFKILKHISIKKGWKIDFYYNYRGTGGEPVIFAYKENYNIDFDALSFSPFGGLPGTEEIDEDYLSHIVLDGSKESFFEYVLLSLIADQFALWWHSNYNDLQIICTSEAVERTLKNDEILKDIKEVSKDNFLINIFDSLTIEELSKVNFAPSVKFRENYAIVRVVTFTKWGGFYEMKFYISKQFPHKELKFKKKQLVDYDCYILF